MLAELVGTEANDVDAIPELNLEFCHVWNLGRSYSKSWSLNRTLEGKLERYSCYFVVWRSPLIGTTFIAQFNFYT